MHRLVVSTDVSTSRALAWYHFGFFVRICCISKPAIYGIGGLDYNPVTGKYDTPIVYNVPDPTFMDWLKWRLTHIYIGQKKYEIGLGHFSIKCLVWQLRWYIQQVSRRKPMTRLQMLKATTKWLLASPKV